MTSHNWRLIPRSAVSTNKFESGSIVHGDAERGSKVFWMCVRCAVLLSAKTNETPDEAIHRYVTGPTNPYAQLLFPLFEDCDTQLVDGVMES